MRIKSYAKGGYTDAGIFGTDGATLTGPLVLSRDPVNPTEAVTKKYADDKLTKGGFVTSGFNKGTVGVSTLPSYSGDLSSAAGSNIFNLPVIGITAGTHKKIEVNARGLVIRGNALIESDIPALPWSKIVSGKPTTLAGWGITGVLLKSGGTMTGALSASGHPTQALQPATLGYVRSKVTSDGNVLQPGDIISKPYKETPEGFLRCNGGRASITMYSQLYNIIKENYKEVNIKGYGKPWRQQYDFNTSSVSPGTWVRDSDLPLGKDYSHVAVTKNRVYLISGNYGAAKSHTAVISSSGVIGPWEEIHNLPVNTHGGQLITTKNKLYLLGGYHINTVYSTKIKEDGKIGIWSQETSLPGPVSYSQSLVTKNRVYLFGGHSGSTIVYSAPIDQEGNIGAWITDTPLRRGRDQSNLVVIGKRVHLLGGNVGTNTTDNAPILDDGTIGPWVEGPLLPTPMRYSQAIVTSNKIFLIGRYNTTDVYSNSFTVDGQLGDWTIEPPLPTAVSMSEAIVTSSRIYLLGGYNNSKIVYYAPFSGGKNDYSEFYDGSNYGDLIQGKFDTISHPGNGQPWKRQYSFNESTQRSISNWREEANLPRGKDYSQAAVTKNRVYLISGSSGAAFVETAPILPDGTIGTWTEHTPLPTNTYSSQVIVTKNKLYVLGGYHHTRVYSALIKVDGTLDEWVLEDPLPANISESQAVITKNRVYLLGGYSNSVLTYTAPIDSNGNIGVWSRGGDLPRGSYQTQAIVTRNKVHLLGGYSSNSLVHTAEILEDGTLGEWIHTSTLPTTDMRRSQAITTSNRVWLLGRSSSVEVYTAAILPDGNLGSWELDVPLLVATSFSQAVITSSRVYLLGGNSNSKRVFSAPFLGGRNDYSEFYDGSIKPIDNTTHFNLPIIPDNNEMGIYNYVKY